MARAAAAAIGATIWPTSTTPSVVDAGPDSPVELGVKFRADSAGTVTAIRFYKAAANTGSHVGNLWTSSGTLLATATFTGESASGWQQVDFSSPVSIAANTVYVASYHTDRGHYSDDQSYFASVGVDRPPLHALRDGASGADGVYAYGSRSTFPSQGYRSSNYWVDVVFVASGTPTPDLVAPSVTSFTIPATSTSLTVPITSFTATDAVGVTGYLLTQSAIAPSATAGGWTSTAPTSFTFAAAGTQTLYAWAKDAAGNISGALSAAVVITLSGATPNLVVDASRLYQTIEGMGANASVELWDDGQLVPALDALAVDNGVSLFRVVSDRMDWVASESDISLLHALDGPTLARIYEAPRMADIWGTIGYLNSLGVKGHQISLNFMGWTAPWMGGSGTYGVVSKVTSGKEDELATMIGSLVYYGRKVKNLDFTYVEPLNEPDWNGLEGPQVGPAQYAKIADALSVELDAMGLTDVRLVGPDTASGPSSYVSALQSDPAAWNRLDHLGWHTYSGPTSPGTAYSGKTWWMTETAQWDSNLDSGGTPAMGEWQFGANTFDIILQDVLNGLPAVLVWEGYDTWYYHHNAYSRWGLLSYDQTAGTYAKRKRFYVNGHLTRWIRPGQQRVSLTAPQNVLAAALVDRTAQTLSIVGHNQNGVAIVLQGSLTNLPFAVTTLQLHQTDSGSKNQTREADVAVSGGRFSVSIGPDTVFTLSTE